jgi:hypothetical protein
MSFMKMPKPDKATIEAQKAQRQAELDRQRELVDQQRERTKSDMLKQRRTSLFSSGSSAGFGRNFF